MPQPTKPSKPFNPHGRGFDERTSKESGDTRDKTGHLGSRDPRTGLILKGRLHPTFQKAMREDEKRGLIGNIGKDGRIRTLERKSTVAGGKKTMRPPKKKK